MRNWTLLLVLCVSIPRSGYGAENATELFQAIRNNNLDYLKQNATAGASMHATGEAPRFSCMLPHMAASRQ